MQNSIVEGKGIIKRKTKTAVNYRINLKTIQLN